MSNFDSGSFKKYGVSEHKHIQKLVFYFQIKINNFLIPKFFKQKNKSFFIYLK